VPGRQCLLLKRGLSALPWYLDVRAPDVLVKGAHCGADEIVGRDRSSPTAVASTACPGGVSDLVGQFYLVGQSYVDIRERSE